MSEDDLADENNTKYLEELEQQNKKLINKNLDLSSAVSGSSFENNQNSNLIQYQLGSDDILDKIEHFLKGDMVKEDDEGNIIYVTQKNKDLVLLNPYGVNIIMQILENYVNRNTNLSFYDDERVNEILADLGDELADFVLCNYERIGLDTEYKKSRYKLLVLNILHIIESAYRRALFGKEREGINSTRIVTQTEGLGTANRDLSQQKRKFNLLDRKTW